jgi:tellurite resistance protein TerC
MSPKKALLKTLLWAVAAFLCSALFWSWKGGEAANQFLAGYLVELSLSADNVFVFAAIFGAFAVGPDPQRRILNWGIAGAAVLRSLFIFAGAGALRRFHWLLYLLGALLFFTALKMARSRNRTAAPGRNPGVRLAERFVRLARPGSQGHFFEKTEGRWAPTRLLLVLVAVEAADVLFAFDSLPAVLAITRTAWIALASNLFAVASLRSLYFALAGSRLRHLETGLIVILLFVGARILAAPWIEVGTGVSLAVVGTVLAISVLSSLPIWRRDPREKHGVRGL